MKIYFTFCFLLFSLGLSAQHHTVYHSSQFEKIKITPSSKSDHVYSIEEDSRGYLWIAEQSGLYRFDGDRFTTVELPLSLGNVIRRLDFVGNNTLLIATTRGLGILNTQSFDVDTRFFHSHEENNFLEDNFIRATVQGLDNTYWVFTKTYLHLLDADFNVIGSYQFRQHPDVQATNPTMPVGFPVDGHRFLMKAFQTAKTLDKDIWWMIDMTTLGKETVILPELKHLTFGTCFHVEPGNVIMVSRDTPEHPQAFYHYDYALRTLDRLMIYDPIEDPSPSRTNTIHTAEKGITFFRYKKGFYYDLNQQRITEEYRNFRPYSRYHKMANGVVYAANSEGLFRLTSTGLQIRSSKEFDQLFSELNFNDGVVDFLKQGSKLHIATHGKGLFILDSTTGTIKQVRIPRFVSNMVWNLRSTSKDSLWIGTQEGLFTYHTTTEKFGKWNRNDLPKYMPDSPITTQFIDSHKILWMGIGYGNGLVAYDAKQDSLTHFSYDKNRFPLRTATTIAEDVHGDLWMGYENGGGLIRWDRSTKTFEKIRINPDSDFTTGRIRVIISSQDGTIWLGNRYGLYHYAPQIKRFTKYTISDGLIDNYITELKEDQYGRIWIGTANGLSILEPETGKFLNVDEGLGIPGKRIRSIKPWDDKDEEMFVGANFGFCLIDINRLQVANVERQVYVEPIQVNNERINSVPGETVKLNYRQNNIAVNFGIVDHSDGRKNDYFYRIQQLDTTWTELNTKGELKLNNLAPGSYKLELQTCLHGAQCYQAHPISFKIRPPFWGSWWFLLSLVVLSILITSTLYLLRIRNLKRIEQVRQQISMDLHDDIGSSISSVRILSDILAQEGGKSTSEVGIIKSIKDQSGHISDVLEEVIWNINPVNDSTDHVVSRMQRYANEILENAGIKVRWEQLEIKSKVPISANKRKEVYLFFKEVINNIVKHAQSDQVWISIRASTGKLHLVVRDNGIGFDPGKSYESNGLKSMNTRSQKLNAKYTINSQLGSGTTVTLEMPI